MTDPRAFIVAAYLSALPALRRALPGAKHDAELYASGFVDGHANAVAQLEAAKAQAKARRPLGFRVGMILRHLRRK